MTGKSTLKRPADDAAIDDQPNKKSTKLGRPMNVGDQQLTHMMDGWPDYVEEKRKKALKQPHKVSQLFDTKAAGFIAKFGWDNPFRTLTTVVSEATDEACAVAQKEADAAVAAVAGGPKSMDAEKYAEQERKDAVVKAVRGEYTKLYQRLFREGVPDAVKPSVDIPKLIRSIMAKPTQRQLYMVWAKLRVRPELEAEVDKRHTAALRETGDSSRGAVWNVVASEWFNASSEDEKVITRREALKILDIEMKNWEEQAAADPSSPAEARAFMEGSEDFLSAMMQFFANRVSGIAVMFLAGPKEVSLSEAVCDVPGQPKVLYSQIAEEETTLRLMGGRILSQSRLMNETKWGAQLDEDEDAQESKPMDVDSNLDPNLDPTLQQTDSQTTPVVNTDSPTAVAAQAARANDVIAEHVQQALTTSTSARTTAAPASACSEQATVQTTGNMPAQRERVKPTPAETAMAEAKSKAARARAILAKAEVEAAEADAEAAALIAAARGPTAATNIEQDADTGSAHLELDQPANAAVHKPVSTPATPTPTPADAGTFNVDASVMAFDPCTTLAGLNAAESEYDAAFAQASLVLSSRKSWWDPTHNPAFFKAVPQKLKHGEADVSVACELSLAYFALEQSGAAEQTLTLASVSDGDPCMPEYLAKFGQAGRTWMARWHKRVESADLKRTPAALDYDVGTTLPRQWALLQPQARLDAQGRVAVPAHASMKWPSGISPGREGVRALVVTLLGWGSNMKNKKDEQVEWRRVAADVAQVLRILAQQGGEFQSSGELQSSELGGRKKLPSAKVRDSNRSVYS